ncbi:MAG: hypothetical protein AAGC47_08320 [Bacteroidota bacterium]
MKTSTLILISLTLSLIWILAPDTSAAPFRQTGEPSEPLKTQVFNILDHKCNVCHKKQNPFMVFNLINMDKRAKKIDKNVFELQRMPKGDEIKLTSEEKEILKNWINTVNTK